MREGYRSNFACRFGRLVDVEIRSRRRRPSNVTLDQPDTKIEEAYVGPDRHERRGTARRSSARRSATRWRRTYREARSPRPRRSAPSGPARRQGGRARGHRPELHVSRSPRSASFAEPELNDEFFKAAFPDGGVKNGRGVRSSTSTRQIEPRPAHARADFLFYARRPPDPARQGARSRLPDAFLKTLALHDQRGQSSRWNRSRRISLKFLDMMRWNLYPEALS